MYYLGDTHFLLPRPLNSLREGPYEGEMKSVHAITNVLYKSDVKGTTYQSSRTNMEADAKGLCHTCT